MNYREAVRFNNNGQYAKERILDTANERIAITTLHKTSEHAEKGIGAIKTAVRIYPQNPDSEKEK